MADHPDHLREQARQALRHKWTHDHVVGTWRTHHAKTAVQTQAMTDALLAAAHLSPGLQVLDLASGSGQPALDLARAVGPSGHVTATDLSEGMLALAEKHARQAGLANLTCQVADAEHLPFPDAAFDRVTSRLGAMYFVDIDRSLREIHRVLRPGGRVTFVVWGPPDQGNGWTLLLGPFLSRVTLPPSPPDAPEMYRFAAPGSLSARLEQAGFRDVTEAARLIAFAYPGPPEETWQQFEDMLKDPRPLFDSLAPEERAAAVREVIENLRTVYDGTYTTTTGSIVVVSGLR